MKKLLVLIVLTWLAISLETQAQTNFGVNAATFFSTCPTVDVTSDTLVEGTATGIGDCNVTIAENVKLTLLFVDLRMGHLWVDGGSGSELTIKDSTINGYTHDIEGPSVKIEDSELIAGWYTQIISSHANASITVKNSQLGRCVVIYSLGPGSPILLKESRVGGCSDDTHIVSLGAGSPITVKDGTHIDSGDYTDLVTFGDDSPITIDDSTVASVSASTVHSYGADGPITIQNTGMLARDGGISVGSGSSGSAVRINDCVMEKDPSNPTGYVLLAAGISSSGAGSPVTVTGTTIKDVSFFATIRSSGDDSPVTVKNCRITGEDDSPFDKFAEISSSGVLAPLTVAGSVFVGDRDLRIESVDRAEAKGNDFTGVEGFVIIISATKCISKDNNPDIPCH